MIHDLTSREAVLAAVDEFEALGQRDFLAKYGFRPARGYFLVHDGKHYDSKAIVGAAHGFQFDRPLAYDEFSGGEQTVATKLESLGFQVQRPLAKGAASEDAGSPAARHPTWNRDELIIALAAYVRWEGNPPAKTSADIMALSQFLNGLRISLGTPAHETLRNANGVYMKLMNFRRFDPAYSNQGKSGLTRGGKLEEEIWDTFCPDPERLGRIADAIRSGLPVAGQLAAHVAAEQPDDEAADFVEAEEGRILSVLHLRRERAPKLAKAKKDQAYKTLGKLCCEVCLFDFHAAYGERGKGFIECHHLRPLESLPGISKTRLDDLALVCANCHRMIHARRPWLDLEALRSRRERSLDGS
jgi:5-methylcytosine-specific restriction protein A